MVTYYKGKISKEDIEFGAETFLRRTSTGAYQELTEVNAAHLPFYSQSSKYLEDLIDKGYDVDIYPQNVIAKSSPNSAMTANEEFTASGGHVYWRDPGGADRNFDPSGTFEQGHWIILINTADDDESIYFDSGGLNQEIAQNQRGYFIYNTVLGWTLAFREVETAVSSTIASTSPGSLIRSKFEYKDTDEIYISAGSYHHNGTTEQIVYWDSQLTFQFGPTGSNTESAALAASDWFYVYLDDSAINTLGSRLLTASQLIANTTEPSWSESKHGWYNGNDRCIFAVETNSSSEIMKFFHNNDTILFEDYATVDSALTGGSYTSFTLGSAFSVPSFVRSAKVTFYCYTDGESLNVVWFWAENTGATNGHVAGRAHKDVSADNSYRIINSTDVYLDSDLKIAYKCSNNDSNALMRVYCDGWYFPIGV